MRAGWIIVLALTAGRAEPAPGSLPFDLVGSCSAPVEAWRIPGLVPGATVIGFEAEGQTTLLAGGARHGDEPPKLGDLTIISPRGWARRRIVSATPLRGLPAMLRKVVLAGDEQGMLHVWPLGYGDRESAPWEVPGDGPLTVGPLVVGETFVFASGKTLFSVSNLVEPRWRQPLPAPADTALASDGEAIYVACGQTLAAFAAEDGAPLWQCNLPAQASTGLLVTAGLVVFGTGDGALRSYDSVSGEAIWSHESTPPASFAPDLALAGPWLLAADEAGTIQALEAATGDPVWQVSLPESAPFGSPTVGFGRVFVVDGLGRLEAIPFDDRQAVWKWMPQPREGAIEKLTGVASIYGNRLYVTTASGALVALDLKDADGPAPWPVPGGTAARNGRLFLSPG